MQLALRDVPPPPERPVEPGFLSHVPWQLGLAVVLGCLYLGYKGLQWLGGGPFDPSLAEAAFLLAGLMWLTYLSDRMAPLEERHPILYGQLAAGGTILPLYVGYGLLGHADLSDPYHWILAALCSVVLGAMMGYVPDEERDELLRLDPPVAADGARAVAGPGQRAGPEPSAEAGILPADP